MSQNFLQPVKVVEASNAYLCKHFSCEKLLLEFQIDQPS